MKFRRRLFLYLTGFAIGCLAVFLMFPTYDWLGWMPGKQVLKTIQTSRVTVTNHAHCRMECVGVSMENFEKAKWEGEVDFSKSDAQGSPKRYLLEHEQLNFILICTDSTTTIAEVSRDNETKKCDCP